MCTLGGRTHIFANWGQLPVPHARAACNSVSIRGPCNCITTLGSQAKVYGEAAFKPFGGLRWFIIRALMICCHQHVFIWWCGPGWRCPCAQVVHYIAMLLNKKCAMTASQTLCKSMRCADLNPWLAVVDTTWAYLDRPMSAWQNARTICIINVYIYSKPSSDFYFGMAPRIVHTHSLGHPQIISVDGSFVPCFWAQVSFRMFFWMFRENIRPCPCLQAKLLQTSIKQFFSTMDEAGPALRLLKRRLKPISRAELRAGIVRDAASWG